MSWAETKCINSTVGTEDFKPLDEIFKGSWHLVSSDNVYFAEKAEYTKNNNTYTLTNALKMLASGTARFTLWASTATSSKHTFEVYKNGTLVGNQTRTVTSTTEAAYSVDATFSEGDVITFKITRDSGNTTPFSLGSITMLAQPIYAPSLIEKI